MSEDSSDGQLEEEFEKDLDVWTRMKKIRQRKNSVEYTCLYVLDIIYFVAISTH
jgi:hypothetical protein